MSELTSNKYNLILSGASLNIPKHVLDESKDSFLYILAKRASKSELDPIGIEADPSKVELLSSYLNFFDKKFEVTFPKTFTDSNITKFYDDLGKPLTEFLNKLSLNDLLGLFNLLTELDLKSYVRKILVLSLVIKNQLYMRKKVFSFFEQHVDKLKRIKFSRKRHPHDEIYPHVIYYVTKNKVYKDQNLHWDKNTIEKMKNLGDELYTALETDDHSDRIAMVCMNDETMVPLLKKLQAFLKLNPVDTKIRGYPILKIVNEMLDGYYIIQLIEYFKAGDLIHVSDLKFAASKLNMLFDHKTDNVDYRGKTELIKKLDSSKRIYVQRYNFSTHHHIYNYILMLDDWNNVAKMDYETKYIKDKLMNTSKKGSLDLAYLFKELEDSSFFLYDVIKNHRQNFYTVFAFLIKYLYLRYIPENIQKEIDQSNEVKALDTEVSLLFTTKDMKLEEFFNQCYMLNDKLYFQLVRCLKSRISTREKMKKIYEDKLKKLEHHKSGDKKTVEDLKRKILSLRQIDININLVLKCTIYLSFFNDPDNSVIKEHIKETMVNPFIELKKILKSGIQTDDQKNKFLEVMTEISSDRDLYKLANAISSSYLLKTGHSEMDTGSILTYGVISGKSEEIKEKLKDATESTTVLPSYFNSIKGSIQFYAEQYKGVLKDGFNYLVQNLKTFT